jgi:hypothetical protein
MRRRRRAVTTLDRFTNLGRHRSEQVTAIDPLFIAKDRL